MHPVLGRALEQPTRDLLKGCISAPVAPLVELRWAGYYYHRPYRSAATPPSSPRSANDDVIVASCTAILLLG
ncbi:hypothetical protein MSG28_002276 [Choristoneura fumiferana]|uniref:Uncharacterized protein n=1 Tax=Choristoneura fumiferana TaxID=7141 RepID=A0ACC0JVG7_CHOFU|nr:hypothetical protein MSG28_002276 [Choristoneura fumiferana]